jgi:peroxiredoxin
MESATVLGTGLTLLTILSIGLTFLLYQLVKQQGRLLLRLDQVERRLGMDPSESIDRESIRLQARASSGLPVGTRLPAFEEFRGRKVLLVNWSARCGYCDLIAPDLEALEPDLEKVGVRLILQETPIEAFDGLGTPVAYLVDEEGRTAHPLAIGADQVLDLAREAAPKAALKKLPLSASRIERDGLKPGTPAPVFTLPDIHGGTVSLDQYRGRKTLLVFSDPHCGPCEQLAPELRRLHDQHRSNGLSVMMIGRGDPEENRRKAEEYGLEFPIILQRKWEVSRQYGIFATPVGFLIDENGKITREVARGTEEILALASLDSALGKEALGGRTL